MIHQCCCTPQIIKQFQPAKIWSEWMRNGADSFPAGNNVKWKSKHGTVNPCLIDCVVMFWVLHPQWHWMTREGETMLNINTILRQFPNESKIISLCNQWPEAQVQDWWQETKYKMTDVWRKLRHIWDYHHWTEFNYHYDKRSSQSPDSHLTCSRSALFHDAIININALWLRFGSVYINHLNIGRWQL